jgi:hypothetical protein
VCDTIIAGNFNISLSAKESSSRQKIKKETLIFSYTLDQMDLTDIYRRLLPTAAHSSQAYMKHSPG